MNTEPLAEITQINWAGIDPKEMGLGPVHAFMPILQQQKMKKSDIDLWEINEAFAAQVLGCQKALNDQNYCKEQLSICLLYTSPSPRDGLLSRMPSSA